MGTEIERKKKKFHVLKEIPHTGDIAYFQPWAGVLRGLREAFWPPRARLN